MSKISGKLNAAEYIRDVIELPYMLSIVQGLIVYSLIMIVFQFTERVYVFKHI